MSTKAEISLQKAKEEFVRNAHWADSIGSAFQRSYAYKKSADPIRKRVFKAELFEFVKKIESAYIDQEVNEKAHLKNIHQLREWTRKYSDLFQNGVLKYGICQKLLNVYLKERWCAGKLSKQPPHFPVDRLIQVKLKLKPLINWTQIDSENEYMEIVNRVKVVAEEKDLSLAEIELLAYNELVLER
ncbi:hypothetical protein GYB29_11445 [bacterium]|nr:hypothetical protein [bacterium]